MSLHFSANQFEDAYGAQRLSNWQVPKSYLEHPRTRRGATRPIADDVGHFRHSGSRKSNNAAEIRFQQSAPLPESSGLFISGSALASTRKSGVEPGVINEVKNPQSGCSDEEDEEETAEEVDFFQSVKMSLPDNPRQAALILAQRQKKHRPLPDLMHESCDTLIPKFRSHPSASATTVESTKAKGPTSCTKRQVIRLLPEAEVNPRRPNVMDLAIKWDATTPPSSAGRNKKPVRTITRKPVEKTLDWLYDNKPPASALQPEYQPETTTKEAIRMINSAVSSDSVVSVGSSGSSLTSESKEPQISAESDPESGYNSPRSNSGGRSNKTNLVDLDPIKVPQRSSALASAVASASIHPPKNHFLVSSAFASAKMNRSDSSILLPEYPLQRRSSSPRSISSGSSHPPLPHSASKPVTHSTRPDVALATKPAATPSKLPEEVEPTVDGDSGFGDPAEENEQPLSTDASAAMKNRSRPCLACCKTSPKHRHPAAAAVATSGYKAAMKAGIPNMKNRAELEAIIQRRQNYRAPKPSALSSHARHIRGTLAPPLSAGCGIEPLVDYPDYKRLDSTYRMSYGAHHLFQQRRRRPKTLTAILNEKNCRQWRS